MPVSTQGVRDPGEPGRGEVLQVAYQQALDPYSGSPERPRRPYFSRTARRRTSPVILTASWTTRTNQPPAGSIRRTAEA